MIRLRNRRRVAPVSRQVGRLTGRIVAEWRAISERVRPAELPTRGGRRAAGRVPIGGHGRHLAPIERRELVGTRGHVLAPRVQGDGASGLGGRDGEDLVDVVQGQAGGMSGSDLKCPAEDGPPRRT